MGARICLRQDTWATLHVMLITQMWIIYYPDLQSVRECDSHFKHCIKIHVFILYKSYDTEKSKHINSLSKSEILSVINQYIVGKNPNKQEIKHHKIICSGQVFLVCN